MSTRATDYTVSLIDKMSAPAATAASNLDKAKRAARDLTEKVGSLKTKFDSQAQAMAKTSAEIDRHIAAGSKDKATIDALTATLSKQAAALDSTSKSIRNTNEKLADLAKAGDKTKSTGLASYVGDVGANLIKTLGPLALAAAGLKAFQAIASEAVESAGHKLAIMGQLEAITGSANKAKEVYDHTQKIADNLTISQVRVQELSTDLLKARMPSTSLEGTITAITALEKGQGPEAAAKLQSLVKGSTFKRSFGITREDALALGVSTNDIYKEIADKTHQGVDEVRGQMMYGQISTKVGLDALNSLVTRKNKVALDIAKNDPTALFAKFKETFSRLFEDVDLSPIADAVRAITLLFDRTTESGKALKMIFGGIFSFVGSAIKFVIPWVSDVITRTALLGITIYTALVPVIGSVKRALKSLGLDTGSFGSVAKVQFEMLLALVEKLGQALSVVGSAFEVITKGLKGDGKGMMKAGDQLGADMFKLVSTDGATKRGADAAKGFVLGLFSKKQEVNEAAKTVAAEVPKGVATELQMHSPSVVLTDQGEMAGDSIGIGLDKSDPAAAFKELGNGIGALQLGSGMGSAMAQAVPSGSTPAASGGDSGGGGRSVRIDNFNVTIQGGGASAKAQAKSMYQEFLKFLEEGAAQLGAPVESTT